MVNFCVRVKPEFGQDHPPIWAKCSPDRSVMPQRIAESMSSSASELSRPDAGWARLQIAKNRKSLAPPRQRSVRQYNSIQLIKSVATKNLDHFSICSEFSEFAFVRHASIGRSRARRRPPRRCGSSVSRIAARKWRHKALKRLNQRPKMVWAPNAWIQWSGPHSPARAS
jgi:hypothetical protein